MMFFSNMSLAKKGLMIVLAPLVVQVVLLAVLLISLEQAEMTMLKVERGREMQELSYEASRALGMMSMNHAFYNATRLPMFNHLEADRNRLSSAMKAMLNTGRQDALVLQFAQCAARFVSIVEDNLAIGNWSVKGSDDAWWELYAIVSDVDQCRMLLQQAEQESVVKRFKDELSAIRRIEQIVAVGAGAAVLAALIVAVFFSRDIVDRLGVVVDNTIRVSQKKTLNQSLSGKDEIAALDRSFHEMVDELNEAAQTKQDFVSMITHDLRTPLTTLQFQLEMLRENAYGEVPEQALPVLVSGQRNLKRLLGLISELLDIEKMQTGKLAMELEPIALSDIVDGALDAVRGFARESRVDLVVNTLECTFEGDRDRLVQVLVNLLSNAVKFTPHGGAVMISSQQTENELVIRICDQGPGISESELPLLFGRFQQTSAAHSGLLRGSGLGLFVCKSIIEGHGGTIGVESKVAEGSTFWFTLPLTVNKPVS